MRITRLLTLFPFIILSTLCWGQNILILDKTSKADELLSQKGICSEYIDALMEASDVALKENDLEAAIAINEKILDAVTKVYPDDAELASSSRSMLALLYSEAHQYEKARPLLIGCYNDIKGKDYVIEAGYLENIITADVELKRWDEAIKYRQEKGQLIKRNEGKGLLYANNLYMLSSLFLEIQDNKSAIEAMSECLSVLDKTEEKHDGLYNDALYRYEVLTTGKSSVQSETVVRRRSAEIMRQYFENHDVNYLFDNLDYLADKDFVSDIDTLRHSSHKLLALNFFDIADYNSTIDVLLKSPYMDASDWFLMGDAMQSVGDLENARESYKYAMAKAYIEKNDVSDIYFTYFDFYARFCIQTGHYQEIFSLLDQIISDEFETHRWEIKTAKHIALMAQLQFSINDYHGAIESVNKCSPLFLKAGAIQEFLMNSLLALGSYEQLGNYQSCINILQSLEKELQPIPEYYEYIPWISISIATYNIQTGNKERASEIVESTMRAYASYQFNNFWMESVYHNVLGHYYQEIGNFEESEQEYLTGARLLKDNAPESDYNYPQQLSALGNLYLQWPQHERNAFSVFNEAYQLIKKYHNPTYASYYGYATGYIASKYASELQIDLSEIIEYIDVEQTQAQSLLFQMSETERDAFWKSHKDTKSLLFSLEEARMSPGVLYDYALFYKGLLLSSSTQIRNIITKANDPELNQLYGRYLLLVQKGADTNESGIVQLEHQILSRCQALGYSINKIYTFEDVLASLGPHDMAVEFIDYEKLVVEADKNGEKRYAALILKGEWDTPVLIEICTEDALTKAIAAKHKAYDMTELFHLIWEPLQPYLSKVKKIYYAPVGFLHNVAIEAIPASKNKFLSEMYDIVRLSSTRELCLGRVGEAPFTTSVVYGGLQYTVSESDMIENSKPYSYRPNNMSESYLSRGSGEKVAWKYLPGTKKEAETIHVLLSNNSVSCTLYTGEMGNEESFKSLSQNSPSILHLATHGFYIPHEKDHDDISALKRSGLILSGANPAWSKGTLIPNVEDGVLTAEEISYLDLGNTSLATISACESGLGDISNDGVEGLQRAFKAAGVQTLVVTLWQVDDEATELMMTEFYKRLLSGKPKRTAFREAQQVVRKKYDKPYYWAPFIMID